MAVPGPRAPFIENVKKLFDNPQFSDLTVTCGDFKWRVHKIIVCTRSELFDNALEADTEEAREGIIDVSVAPALVVEALLRRLYTLDYSDFDYSDYEGTGQEDMSRTELDVQVHMLAHYVGIKELEKLAVSKFEKHANEDWDTAGFANAVEFVYTSAADHDRQLRDCIINVTSKHAKELYGSDSGKRFREVVSATPNLGSELSDRLARGATIDGGEKFTCSGCQCKFSAKVPEKAKYYWCPCCGTQFYAFD